MDHSQPGVTPTLTSGSLVPNHSELVAGLLVEVGAGGSSQAFHCWKTFFEADGTLGFPSCSTSLRELKTILPLVNFKVSSAKFLKDKFLVSFVAQPG